MKGHPKQMTWWDLHSASGFMPSHSNTDRTTPDVSPGCSRDKDTIKDITVNQPLINYNRIRSLKGFGNRSELCNSIRKIAVCSW